MSEFDKVIGYEAVKFELKRVCDVLKNFDKYEKLGVKQPAGILLHGDVGLGKTLMANCFVKESGWNVYVCRKDKPNGDFVKQIKILYQEAELNQPAIVLLDDMDKYSNDGHIYKNSDEFITIQSCIDDAKGKRVFTFATANDIGVFPNSLTRFGRFDKIIELQKPKGEDCKKIVKYYLSQKKFVADLDFDEIAKILSNASCAELETIINEAGIYAGTLNKELIEMDDIIRACMRVIFKAPEALSCEKENNIEILAYHEAGHAVINEILEPGSVNLLSVCKYQGDIGGITSCTMNENYFSRKSFMENRVISLLGGKAATELIFNEVDVGANSDLHRAFDIVERFVDNYCAYGFDKFERHKSSNNLLSRKEDMIFSETERYYKQAKDLLYKNKDFLNEVAHSLIEKRTLRAKDIAEIKQKLQLT